MVPVAETGKVHFRVLDGWRGIAAILVAVFHLNLFSAIYSLDFIRYAFLFVDFFFVLSGFVITHSYGDRLATLEEVSAFALKRFGRLWPLHVVVLLAFVAVECVKAAVASRGTSFYLPPFTGPNSLDTIPLNLVFAQSFGLVQHLTWNPPSWSISAEFWTYLVFGIALFAGSRWSGRSRIVTVDLVVLLLAGSILTLVRLSEHGIDATYDLGFVRCLYGFLIGHLTYRLFRTVSRTNFNAAPLEWGVLVVVIAYVSLAGRSGYSFFAPLVFACVVFVFAFEAGLASHALSNRVSDWLGRVSYSIYMWQAFIIFNFVDRPVSILEKMTGRILTTTEGAGSALGSEAGKLIVLGSHVLPIVVTLLFVGVLVGVASVSYYLIELPGRKLIGRLTHRRSSISLSPR